MNEKVFDADVIVRATLVGTQASAGRIDDEHVLYKGVIDFRFETLEYLKGEGDDELLVSENLHLHPEVLRDLLDRNGGADQPIFPHLVEEGNPFTTLELALLAAKSWERERDARWEDREAIILAYEVVVPGSSDGSIQYSFRPRFAYGLETKDTNWLPAFMGNDVVDATSDALSDDKRFILGGLDPESLNASSTISVSEMKSLIAKSDQWRREGEGNEAYRECIQERFRTERYINKKKERGENPVPPIPFGIGSNSVIESGLPAGTVVYEGSSRAGRIWFENVDEDLLLDLSANNTGVVNRTTRPLPAGEYAVYYNFQREEWVPCDYYPEESTNAYELRVFARPANPNRVVCEGFFDPVDVGSALGADVVNGAKPVRAIARIEWEAEQVRMEYSPSELGFNYAHMFHYLDFIALDGRVTLRLNVDDATPAMDGDRHTLTWGMYSQPWQAGDKLMLRMSRSGPPVTASISLTVCPNP